MLPGWMELQRMPFFRSRQSTAMDLVSERIPPFAAA